mmetsp:Transcript_21747/g.43144  ORF Transcript_21747/g.43144 Transcript_21747/m.43144 type:complete len:89 (+) Transcript_21747:71-337(+)
MHCLSGPLQLLIFPEIKEGRTVHKATANPMKQVLKILITIDPYKATPTKSTHHKILANTTSKLAGTLDFFTSLVTFATGSKISLCNWT